MKRLVFYSSFLISLISLSLSTIPAQAQPCQKINNAQSTAYGLREQDRRCEGIRAEDISGDFSLISLTLGKIQPSSILKLQVPDRANGQEPKVLVTSKKKNYQLDPLEFRYSGGVFQVQWSDGVIRAAGISLDSLRAIASVRSGVQKVYLPVILSPGAGQYQIVLSNERPAKIPIFQILRNGTVVYSDARNTFQPKGQIKFTWQGRDRAGNPLPAGRYELRVKADLEQDNAPPQPASVSVAFEHDPKWLK
ncbi:MAG: hypothetical protein KME42_24915 [Tildeniella nuda ZEHNDER 1965/U140]|nr:hypothetical protein [Tildeniella nuda ZEHNDER 1965/U140]